MKRRVLTLSRASQCNNLFIAVRQNQMLHFKKYQKVRGFQEETCRFITASDTTRTNAHAEHLLKLVSRQTDVLKIQGKAKFIAVLVH
jgi:hypothetical protein